MMHLHRQLGAPLDGNMLALITVSAIGGVKHPPRAIDHPVIEVITATISLYAFDDRLHVLHPAFMGDQHGVLGLYDYQIFHANRCNLDFPRSGSLLSCCHR